MNTDLKEPKGESPPTRGASRCSEKVASRGSAWRAEWQREREREREKGRERESGERFAAEAFGRQKGATEGPDERPTVGC